MMNRYHNPVAAGGGNMGDCWMMQFLCAQSAKTVSTIEQSATAVDGVGSCRALADARSEERAMNPARRKPARYAPYADGRYLCAVCRAEYMELHHPDPFRDDAVPEVMQA